MRKPPFPKSHTFPGGYHITIRLATPTEIAEEVEVEPHEVGGCWDVEKRQILIDKTQSASERWKILAHELQHAALDYSHWLHTEGISS